MRSGLFLVLLFALPGPVAAQAGAGPASPNRVSGTGALLLKASQIAEENRLHFGGWAGVLFAENLAVGGGGFTLLERVGLSGSEGPTGFDLGFGYGGLLFRYWESLSGPLVGEVGLLLGAGHAEVQNQLTSREVGADNFLVAEAEMSALYSFFPGTHVGLSLGYRITTGVEDLPGVSEGDLNGFTGTLSFRIGGH
jgi:hypothetical protein